MLVPFQGWNFRENSLSYIFSPSDLRESKLILMNYSTFEIALLESAWIPVESSKPLLFVFINPNTEIYPNVFSDD